MVDALPRGRLAVSPYETGLPSRLVVLRVRAWTWGNDVFGFKPSDVTLVLSDGTTANAFDGDRARILLDRLNVGPVDNLGATPDGWAASPGGADLALSEEVRYSLLYDGDLTRDEPVYGYVVLDAQQPLSSLDGAVLQVALIRRSDGHVVRRSHRFGVDVPADERSTQ